ncbi:MAG TPA: hypothetical protein DIU15_17825 [Deltaproteobacteria bacterium]|nr:hypothetical protein [Deltaproteobacteria bacterium]HCP47903.1 hypothetical protein [Deltaproteobacteria bacterium]|tara:strand:- start:1145 stop:1522 length:378 start_codon:yes stop_codon:yes gene_type:complete
MALRLLLPAALALSLSLAVGCGDPGEDGLPQGLGDCPEESTVVWATVQPILDENCSNRCHSSVLDGGDRQGAPVESNYDTSAAAALNAEYTWQRIQTGQMPNDEPMSSDADALTIREWLACGAPE